MGAGPNFLVRKRRRSWSPAVLLPRVPIIRKSVLLLWLCCGAYTASRAQLLRDADTQGVLRQAIDRIYNFQFAEAEPLIGTVRARYPQHPVSPMLVALKLYWQGMPLRKEKPMYAEYLRQVQLTLSRPTGCLPGTNTTPKARFSPWRPTATWPCKPRRRARRWKPSRKPARPTATCGPA
jgi:hypothetical protein